MKKIKKAIIVFFILIACLPSLIACDYTTTETINIVITPKITTLNCGESEQFNSSITPGSTTDKSVIWSVVDSSTGSTITKTGLFVAGTGSGTVLVKATANINKNKSAFATITISKKDVDPIDPIDPDTGIYFYDDFNGTSLDSSKWTCQIGIRDYEYNGPVYWGNNEAQYYKKENAVVSDGTLKINAKKEIEGDRTYTSARIITRGNFSSTYGRYEAKIKLPAGQGYWPAFWLLPDVDTPYGNWPYSGELDIMEARGRLTSITSAAVHYGVTGHLYQSAEQTFTNGDTISNFHVYALEWEPNKLSFYVDDKLILSVSNWQTNYTYPAPFDVNFYIILNLAVGGNFDGGLLPNQDLGVMEVDYVKVSALD